VPDIKAGWQTYRRLTLTLALSERERERDSVCARTHVLEFTSSQ
jgi:hypothetical protein